MQVDVDLVRVDPRQRHAHHAALLVRAHLSGRYPGRRGHGGRLVPGVATDRAVHFPMQVGEIFERVPTSHAQHDDASQVHAVFLDAHLVSDGAHPYLHIICLLSIYLRLIHSCFMYRTRARPEVPRRSRISSARSLRYAGDGPRQLAVGEGLLAGVGERDERGGAESEFAPPSADDEPLDPAAGAGRLHEEVQPELHAGVRTPVEHR